jgi:hypothetical protein
MKKRRYLMNFIRQNTVSLQHESLPVEALFTQNFKNQS